MINDDVEMFELHQRVRKRNGYRFPGIVVSVFWTTTGKVRYVVEADSDDFKGMLHIFSNNDLESR